MTDVHTKKQRSYNMPQIRAKGTKPELLTKGYFEKQGFIYQPNLYGKPDFVNYGKKTIIFIDGCFWHKCPKCFKLPKTNISFWKKKINKNDCHDKEVTLNYKKAGWKVARIWEHDIRKLK